MCQRKIFPFHEGGGSLSLGVVYDAGSRALVTLHSSLYHQYVCFHAVFFTLPAVAGQLTSF